MEKGAISPILLGIFAIIIVVAGAVVVGRSGTGVEDMAKDAMDKGVAVAQERGEEMVEKGKDVVADSTEQMMDKGKEMVEEGTEIAMDKGKETVADAVDDAMDKGKDAVVDAVSGTSQGTYEEYAAEKIAQNSQDVILYFSAPWCPTCRALGQDIEEREDEIPSGVTILKADYDSEVELKQKYGVTQQHTLVQVDADGELIKKWIGSPNLDDILTKME